MGPLGGGGAHFFPQKSGGPKIRARPECEEAEMAAFTAEASGRSRHGLMLGFGDFGGLPSVFGFLRGGIGTRLRMQGFMSGTGKKSTDRIRSVKVKLLPAHPSRTDAFRPRRSSPRSNDWDLLQLLSPTSHAGQTLSTEPTLNPITAGEAGGRGERATAEVSEGFLALLTSPRRFETSVSSGVP